MTTPSQNGPRPKSSVFTVRVPPARHDLPDDEEQLVWWYDAEKGWRIELQDENQRLKDTVRERDEVIASLSRDLDHANARLAEGGQPSRRCSRGHLSVGHHCKVCGEDLTH